MIRQDLVDERSAKKSIGIKDYDLLATPGVLGFYEECELTHVFFIEDKVKFYHYFAIVSFEEFCEPDKKRRDQNITTKLLAINDRISMGICQKRVSMTNAKSLFTQLCDGQYVSDGKNFILPKDIQLLPKVHIPSLWGYESVPLNKIIKPNYFGDRYIIEFAAIENPAFEHLNAMELHRINLEIKALLPIDLESVYDRIGSFIFEFPITIATGYSGISNDWTKAIITLRLHPSFAYKDSLRTVVTTKLDEAITGHFSYDGIYASNEFEIGDSNNLECKIFNSKNNIIYCNSMGNFVRNVSLSMGMGTQNSEPRTFIDSKRVSHQIELHSYSVGIDTGKAHYYDTRTKRRIIQNEIIGRSGRFLNVRPGERENALDFIRNQINTKSPSCSEVWLWDPYLSYSDIIDILFYVDNSDILMKCITSFTKNKDRIDEQSELSSIKLLNMLFRSLFKKKSFCSYDDFKTTQKVGLLTDSNNIGIRLIFRASHERYGFNFHDRFLFLIPKNIEELPTVFSLGASVNGIGKSHHLIQQTLDPRSIIKTFEELWQILDNEESTLIKLPEDLNDQQIRNP